MDILTGIVGLRLSKLIVSVSDDDKIARLDLFLSKKIHDCSRSYISNLILSGNVLVNGKKVVKKYLPKVGDIVFVDIDSCHAYDDAPIAQNIPLDIAYEDDYLLVVNKPKGMVTHPAPGNYENTLVNALLYYTNNLSDLNSKIRPGIVHRLDKDTSGLMVVAKNNFIHEKLSNQIRFHKIKREYVGIVHGRLKNLNGKIDLPIGRNPKDRKKMSVVYKNSKNAITNYEVIKEFEKYSYVKFILETGRTHQIRVHMSNIGHPLLGDLTYGGKQDFDFLNGQCLHSIKIEFNHPIYNKLISLTSDLPEYFQKILSKIR